MGGNFTQPLVRREMASGLETASLMEETFGGEHAQLWVEWPSELSTVAPSSPKQALMSQLWVVASILTI